MNFNVDLDVSAPPPTPKKKTAAKKVKKPGLGDRGKKAEDAVAKFGKAWAENHSEREFNRLLDTRAAGRVIKAAKADFEYFGVMRNGGEQIRFHGLIEVKETQHDYRLSHDKVPQLAALVHRARCGGHCLVLIHHSTSGRWRCETAQYLHMTKTGASWDLRNNPTYASAKEALESFSLGAFRA